MCLLFLDDSAEFNQVNAALLSIFKIEAKGETEVVHQLSVFHSDVCD